MLSISSIHGFSMNGLASSSSPLRSSSFISSTSRRYASIGCPNGSSGRGSSMSPSKICIISCTSSLRHSSGSSSFTSCSAAANSSGDTLPTSSRIRLRASSSVSFPVLYSSRMASIRRSLSLSILSNTGFVCFIIIFFLLEIYPQYGC